MHSRLVLCTNSPTDWAPSLHLQTAPPTAAEDFPVAMLSQLNDRPFGMPLSLPQHPFEVVELARRELSEHFTTRLCWNWQAPFDRW